jgi:hypothetical protein
MSLIALVVALSLAVVTLAVTLLYRARIERQRSDARVAVLAAALDDPLSQATWADGPRPFEAPAESRSISLAVPEEVHWFRIPAFAVAALAVLSASALLVVAMNSGGPAPRHPAANTPSIELMSMRHALDGETLIVSGLVRNPTPTTTPALSAVVSVLGRDGQIVARGESPLNPVMLEPGKETIFRVSVPQVADPGRYRVAFLNGSHIVPHLDRRADLSRTALANDARGN